MFIIPRFGFGIMYLRTLILSPHKFSAEASLGRLISVLIALRRLELNQLLCKMYFSLFMVWEIHQEEPEARGATHARSAC